MLELTDRLQFGKHKGATVQSLIKTDPGYLNWLREEKKKNRDNLLSVDADAALRKAAGKQYHVTDRVSAATESGEKAMTKLEKDFKRKAEQEAREADAKRTREEVYGQEWGGW